MRKKSVYFADFETTTMNENNEVRVYLWCVVKKKLKRYGEDIESFIDYISKIKGIMYFHNLKFDFSYIHYYCLKHDIKVEICEKKGQLYSCKLFNIELRDSLNFLNMSLKEVGENYCENYKKTSIDYNVDFNHKATPEEIEYCFNDCYVLEEGLNNYFKTLQIVLIENNCPNSAKMVGRKLTNAGIAFEAFKELSLFSECCPKTTQAQYELWKRAYHGGLVYSNPRGIVTNVQMIDCNSMYPYIYSKIDMPYGSPIKFKCFEQLEKYKFYIVKIYIKYDLKPGYIAIIGGGFGKYGGIEYKKTSNGEYEELIVCNTDLNLIKQFYYCDIKLVVGWAFETKPEFFKEYADVFIKVKNENPSGSVKRAVAKILLNSPYGKTAMNGFNEIKNWFIDEKTNTIESEVVGYNLDKETYQYLPMAIQITAGARELLLTTAVSIGFDKIHYMDTDSIKYSNVPTPIVFDPNTLGAWKDEGLCDLFKTIAPKKYVYYHHNKIYYTCAGFNKKVLTEQMKHGQEVTKEQAIQLMNKFDSKLSLECLQSKIVKGGRALIPVLKEIK